MDDRSISASDLANHQNEFIARFEVDGGPYTKAPVQLQWVQLEDIMRPFVSPEGSFGLGLKAYVGWDGGSLRIAIAPLLLMPTSEPNEFQISEEQRFEVIQQGQEWILKAITDWETRWRGNSNAYIDKYYEVTTVDRKGNGPEPLDPKKDPCATIISWDWALLEMYLQNKEAGDDPQHVTLKISNTASWSNGGDGGLLGYRHLLSFNICYDGIDRLDGTKEDPTYPYKHRGANYAQPCPARCSTYVTR